MKFVHTINSFSSGELSEKVKGRTDAKSYASGVKTMENALPYRSGGGFKRPGLEHLFQFNSTSGNDSDGNPTDTNLPVRIIPYTSEGEGYLIALRACTSVHPNDTYAKSNIRFFHYDKFNGNLLEKNWGSDGQLDLSGLSLDGFNFVQVGDVLVVAHTSNDMPPFYIVRHNDLFEVVGHLNYNSIFEQYGLGGILFVYFKYPWFSENKTSITLQPAATSGIGINLTASSSFFVAGHVGSFFRIIHGATEGICRVTGYTSVTVVVVTIEQAFGGATASDAWCESAWSPLRGYPGMVTVYQDRVVLAGTKFKKDTIYFSRVGYLNFFTSNRLIQDAATDVTGRKYFGDALITDAFDTMAAGARTNKIEWIIAGKVLNIGSVGGEYTIKPAGAGGFGYSNHQIEQQTGHGGSSVQPVMGMNLILFVSSDGRRVHGFRYSEENGSYIAPDLTILADHIFDHSDTYNNNSSKLGLFQVAWHTGTSTLWAITSHRALVGLTLDTTLDVSGWHRHTLGGDVFSLAMVPAAAIEECYVTMGREINSVTKYSIERMSTYFDRETFATVRAEDDDAFYMDSAIRGYNITGTVWRASHLPSTEVRVLADGTDLGLKTLDASGDVDLGASYTSVLMGLTYKMVIQTNKLEAGSQVGSGQIAPQRIDKILFRLYKSLSGKYGWSSAKTYPIDFTKLIGSSDSDWAKSGDFITEFSDGSYKEDRSIYIEDDSPFPLNVLMLDVRGQTQD